MHTAQTVLPILMMAPIFLAYSSLWLLIRIPELRAIAIVFGISALDVIDVFRFISPVFFPFAGEMMIVVVVNVVMTIR